MPERPTGSLIRSKEITRDSVAKTVLKPLMRAMIAAVAFGLGLTVLGTALIDSLIRRQARQRQSVRRALEPERAGASAGAGRRPLSAGLDVVLPGFEDHAARPAPGASERRRPHLVTAMEMADDTVEFGKIIPTEGLRPAQPGGSPAQAGQG